MSLHFDLEAAILFALPHEFIIVFRVELNRQRVAVAGQRAAFPRLGFYPDRAARLEIAVDFRSLALNFQTSRLRGPRLGRFAGRGPS